MAKKEKKIHYIYKTTCKVTGKYYVGMHSTHNLDDGYLGSGKRLRYSIRKYGVDSHIKEILEFLPNRDELKLREREIVNEELIQDKLCLNLILGGEGGRGFTQEEQKLNSHKSNEKQKILRKNPEWVHKKSMKQSETRKKKYEEGIWVKKHFFDWSGLNHSEKTKQKMSESSKNKGLGDTNSQFGTCWITNGDENKKIHKGDEIPLGWKLGRVLKKQ
jgi:hypothetical protein